MALIRFSLASLADLPDRISRRTVILAVMAILLFQVTGIFYKIVALQLVRAIPAPAQERVVPAAAQSPRPPAAAYGAITARNLFRVTVAAAEDSQKQAAAPRQDLALLLDLRGTVAGDGAYGFAIVEEKPARKQRLIKTGEQVAGAQVLRIRRNAVDFQMGGQPVTLRIVEAAQAPLLPPAAGRPAAPPPRASGPIVVNRTEIAAALQDMGTMLRQAQVRPVFSAGKPDGFVVTGIRQGSLYQRLGIVEGDVIQGVNNRPIQTADDVMMLFNTLKEGSAASLTLKRQGSQETLSYQFQ